MEILGLGYWEEDAEIWDAGTEMLEEDARCEMLGLR